MPLDWRNLFPDDLMDAARVEEVIDHLLEDDFSLRSRDWIFSLWIREVGARPTVAQWKRLGSVFSSRSSCPISDLILEYEQFRGGVARVAFAELPETMKRE